MQRQTANLLIIIIWEEHYVVGQVVSDQSNPNQIPVSAPVPDRDAIFTTRTEPFGNISMRSIFFFQDRSCNLQSLRHFWAIITAIYFLWMKLDLVTSN